VVAESVLVKHQLRILSVANYEIGLNSGAF
jgi:hypothetical protein